LRSGCATRLVAAKLRARILRAGRKFRFAPAAMSAVTEKTRHVKGLRAQFALRFWRFAGSACGILREGAGTHRIAISGFMLVCRGFLAHHEESQQYAPIVLRI
jgi:hypothetical protein